MSTIKSVLFLAFPNVGEQDLLTPVFVLKKVSRHFLLKW